MAPFSMTIFVPLHIVATGRGKFKEKNVFNVREFHVDSGKIKALKESRKSEICSKYDLIPLVLASSFPLQMQMQAQVGFTFSSLVYFHGFRTFSILW